MSIGEMRRAWLRAVLALFDRAGDLHVECAGCGGTHQRRDWLFVDGEAHWLCSSSCIVAEERRAA